MSEVQDGVARRTSIVMSMLVLVLMGVVSFQYLDYRNFRASQLEACVERREYDNAANRNRRTQTAEFQRLGGIISSSYPPGEARDDIVSSFARLSADAKRAADAAVRRPCE